MISCSQRILFFRRSYGTQTPHYPQKKSEAENAHLDPLMRALKALHSAGAPESMTAEELERQRRSQEVLGKLTAPMTGMDYENLPSRA